MAEEEDFSSLPLTDRWVHKVWKVRKQAYEDATEQFKKSPDEYDAVFKPFVQEPSLWKSAAGDSNVAAQTDALAALCAFLQFGPRDGCLRARQQAVTPIVEKGLISTRPATKTSSIEALLLFVEVDVPGPVIEDILPALSHKQPKVIAASLVALTTIFHNFGCRTADPKPVLKLLPKVFGHADKNVRAEATNLAVEFYRWLREAMKPMFWTDLKPTQQTDLEAQFEKVKAEAPPKQERLLRSQQAAREAATAAGDDGGGGDEDEAEEPAADIDAFDLAEPQDVLSKVPKDFYDNLGSSKWKERKEALDALYVIVNVPRIKDGDYHELNRSFAKCMKDANIAVVTQAAQCIELLAKGLRRPYGKYRATIMQPIMERMKEKKQSVADALGAALEAVFLTTDLTECLEDIQTYLVHKNPQVKEGVMKFLIRCLRTTRTVPSKQEIASMVESSKKLITESSEALRSGGAEILGTIMKIIGERAMNPHLDGLDEIRKTKVKEFFDTAEVKAKEKPKPPPAPAPASRGPGTGKKVVGKKGAPGAKKVVAHAAADTAPLAPQLTSRPTSGPGSKLGMPKPSALGGLKAPQKRTLAGPGSPRRAAPARDPSPPVEDESPPVSPPQVKPAPRIGLARGGLAGRSLAKPAAPAPAVTTPSPPPSSGLAAIERAELEELRAANDQLLRKLEEGQHEQLKLRCEVLELKNQNATLIEDHTRDVLSIKAKETQLVRARSDAESAESTNERLRRELDRLKRALAKSEAKMDAMAMNSPGSPASPSPMDDAAIYRDGGAYGQNGPTRSNRMSFASTVSEEKENGAANGSGNGELAPPYSRSSKLSPELRYAASGVSNTNSGRASPARGYRRDLALEGSESGYTDRPSSRSASRLGQDNGSVTGGPPAGGAGAGGGTGVESWRRAAEVTSQLKARIEQMKARQGLSR